jgi:hypothetical protein
MKKLQLILILFIFTISVFAQKEQLLNLKRNLPFNLKSENIQLVNPSFEKKSAGLAVLYSLLLPGMGELYAGDYSTGQYFTIADGVLWSFFAGFTVYGNDKKADYKSFAQSSGGVNLNGKDETYFANISLYQNITEYNTAQELNRDFEATYDVTTDSWDWGSNATRKEFRGLWSSSENAFNNVRFAVGALVLNRIVSAIFAVKAVNNYNKQLSNDVTWKLNFGVQNLPDNTSGLIMNFQQRF